MNKKGQCTERECDQSVAKHTEDLSTSSATIRQVFKTKKELKKYKAQKRFKCLLHLILLSAKLLDREFHLLHVQRATPVCRSPTTVDSDSDGNSQNDQLVAG